MRKIEIAVPRRAPRARLSVAGLLAVMALLSGACASTAQRDGTPLIPPNNDVGLPSFAPGDTAPDAGTSTGSLDTSTGSGGGTTTGTTGTSSGGGSTGGSGTGVGATTGGATTGTAGGGSAIRNGVGITQREIKLGFLIAAGSPGNAVGGGLGFDRDTNTQIVRAFVEELNATGGVAGRRVVNVNAYIDNTDQSTGTQTRLQNEACVHFTEDERVFAVISLQPLGVNFSYDCYARHRTPLIDATLNGTQQATFDRLYPWLMTPVYMNATRMAQVLATSLHQQRFLTQKVGLISYDRPDLRESAQQVLIPMLQRAGGKVVDQVYLEGSYEGLSSGTANAALKFNAAGIDRVVMWAPGGGALILFARQAESQGYRPRYGISTYDAPALVHEILGRAAPAQLAGATGAGFIPSTDLADAQSGPLTSREKACYEVVRRRAGLSYSTRRGTNPSFARATCELTRFIQFVLTPGRGRGVVQADVARFVALVGNNYPPVNVQSTSFHRHKLDGAAAYRHLYFADDCDCFQYRGSWLRAPS